MIEPLRTPETAFFEMIHTLLEAQRAVDDEDETAERRSATRSPFQHAQLLAPFDGARLPGHAAFRAVQCRDLSPGGFSFYSPIAIETPQVIVALGVVPFSFFSAQIMRQEPCGEGRGVLTGCRFLQRLR